MAGNDKVDMYKNEEVKHRGSRKAAKNKSGMGRNKVNT